MVTTNKEPSQWVNRIIGYGEEDPEQLLANPNNWRIHPSEQQLVVSQLLNKVGVVQTVLVNQRTGHLIDGHLRVTLAIREEQKSIPVAYVDISEEDEAVMLASLDTSAAMAVADTEQLSELLRSVSNEDFTDILEAVARQTGIDPTLDPPEDFPSYDDDIVTSYQCPKCGYRWSGKMSPGADDGGLPEVES